MKSRTGKILLYGFVALTLIVLVRTLVLMYPGFKESYREEAILQQTFDRYTASLVSRRYEEAYTACGTDFRRATPYDQFVQLHDSLQDKYGPLKSVKRAGHEMHGRGTPMVWTGVIDADFTYEKRTIRFEFNVAKENGRWVLVGFEKL